MEIEMISGEKIKPNSPTPNHLKIYKISRLDQTIYPAYNPAILFFAPDPTSNNAESISERTELLKKSLGLTLKSFYPFAGVIRDALSVDCNDEGLAFLIAKVKGQMRDFLQHPDLQLINSFLPSECSWKGSAGPGANVATIQLNCFDCGGIAISVIFARNIADITSICTFLRAWAATARGSTQLEPLNCIAQSAFPQKVAMQEESDMFSSLPRFLSSGKFVTRRYVFDASAISALKAQSKMISTRVEVVSAFIWKCFMQVAAENSCPNDQKPFWLTHPVNLRRRAESPFPDNSFGNFLWLASALCTNPMDNDFKGLVEEVKRAIRRIDKELVKSLQSDQGYRENFEDFRKGMPEEATWLAFTSWSKIGLYDIDFGWGMPTWLAGAVSGDSDTAMPNSAALADTRSGDGIEAWVNLHEKYVARFENNEELNMYARFNPSVI